MHVCEFINLDYYKILCAAKLIEIIHYWCFRTAGNGINQAFPNNESYRCRFPSLILQCSFSPGPVVILWSLPENNITNIQYSAVKGLVIDNSSVGNGHSILMVSNRMFFYKGYMCAAINSDGSQEITTVQPVPFTNLTLETNSCTSLAIKWIHPYPECKRYLVIVDGAILRDNITDTNYTITGLAPSTKYNVTVVASTDDPLPVQIISEAFMTASGERTVDWDTETHIYVARSLLFLE